MQFHVPQSRLLRTPGEYRRRTICRFRNAKICVAREASKKIVEDLLLTAGGNVTDDLEDDESPSVVKRGFMDEDDTF